MVPLCFSSLEGDTGSACSHFESCFLLIVTSTMVDSMIPLVS